jgi:hypothetical protein
MAFTPVKETNQSKTTGDNFTPAHASNSNINKTSVGKGPAVSVQQSLGKQNRGTSNLPNAPIKREV